MQAIVLAGGLGTRLRGVVDDLPKPMAPVRGRPFLTFVLDQLVDAGFTAAVLATGYLHEALHAHFGADYRGLALEYSVEARPLGTGAQPGRSGPKRSRNSSLPLIESAPSVRPWKAWSQ